MAQTEKSEKTESFQLNEKGVKIMHKIMGLVDCTENEVFSMALHDALDISLAKAKGSPYFIKCFNDQVQETLEYLAKLTHATEHEVVAEALKHYERKVLQANSTQPTTTPAP